MKSTVLANAGFHQLVKTHHEMVWRYLRLLGCDAALAEDLTQETFLGVFRRPFEEISPTSSGAYLRRAARSRFIDAMRKSDRTVPLDLNEADQLWVETSERDQGKDWRDALNSCLELIEERPREMLDLRYQQQLPIRKVAEKMGMKESGIKSMLGRIKSRLRDCIERKVNGHD